MYMRGFPRQNSVSQPQTGVTVGATTGFTGFVCEQPYANPKVVSSIAASNAPPQFGSLPAAYDQNPRSPNVIRSIECISPGSTTGVVEERADIVGKTVLGTSWHRISFGKIQSGVQLTARALLYVPEGRSRAVSTASNSISVSQRAIQAQGECLYLPLHA